MLNAHIYHISIPMKIPFLHSQSKRHVAESVIVSIQYKDIVGIGECVPRMYVTGEDIASVIAAIMEVNLSALLLSIDFSTLDSAIYSYNNQKETYILFERKKINAICAIEIAIFDLLGQYFNCSIKQILKKHYIPAPLKELYDVKYLHTSQTMDLSLSSSDFIGKRGPFHTIKIKVDNNIELNVRKIEQVRKFVGDEVPIIIDSNMAWNLKDAVQNIEALKSFNISFYEEPLLKHDWVNYRRLRLETGVKILLDESLCTVDDANEAIMNKACDAFNIRLSKCGGFSNAAKLLQIAYENKINFQIGAQVAETGPLIAAGRHFASAAQGHFAFEAGQPDRYFNDYIITPMPTVDRTTNYATPIEGVGLGVKLNKNINHFLVRKIELNLFSGKAL